jgi:hypothetical protein
LCGKKTVFKIQREKKKTDIRRKMSGSQTENIISNTKEKPLEKVSAKLKSGISSLLNRTKKSKDSVII